MFHALIRLALVCLAAGAAAADTYTPPPEPSATKDVKVAEVAVKGEIEGKNITFTLSFDAECEKGDQEVPLIAGDATLVEVASPKAGYQVRYEPQRGLYFMRWPRRGRYAVSASFAVRPKLVDKGPWHEAAFTLPASRARQIEVVCDHTDLEVKFPGALRLERAVREGKLVLTAILGPGLPFVVRWKPQVAELDAKLVFATEANTIAAVSADALRLDTLYVCDIAQGKLTDLSFIVPKDLSVTQVRGQHIRDWRIEDADAGRRLLVVLNRPTTQQYAIQVISEAPLPKLPAEVDLPVIQPDGGIRAGGFLALGTDSAIHLVIKRTGGLSQTDAGAFPRILLDRSQPRPLPEAKTFCYAYASTPYQLRVALDDVVPSYDVTQRLVATVREDDLTIEGDIELDIRDAPLREMSLDVDPGMVVAAVTGEEVDDYTVMQPQAERKTQEVKVRFRKPALGRGLVRLKLELGRSPLDAPRKLGGVVVRGVKNERGYLAVVVDRGVLLDEPKAQGLREAHTASLPMQAPNAQFAYRFRESGWTLELSARRRPAGVLAEAFHLVTLGEGVLYGYVVVNYLISGAPVDELSFRVSEDLQNVEFVGSDVRTWAAAGGGKWTVKLRRKVVGDYNLAVSYSRRYQADEALAVGGVACEGVETHTGFLVVASHRNIQAAADAPADKSLLEIKRDEIPDNYRLLASAPVLKAYKYVKTPERPVLRLGAYEKGALLPVVVELMDLVTQVNVREKGEAESVTRVRYKVKNTSSQYLSVVMPEAAAVWATRLIERQPNGAEVASRVRSSYAADGRTLLVPLKRQRDPNDPITVEIEYGQAHGGMPLGGRLNLQAPAASVQATYARWAVNPCRDWAVLPVDSGNMAPGRRAIESGDLAAVMDRVASCWRWITDREPPAGLLYAVGGVAVLILAVVAVVRRSALPAAIVALCLLLLLAAGLLVTRAPAFRFTDDLAEVSVVYTQALNLDKAAPPAIAVRVVPSWRRFATLSGAVVTPLAALACAALGALWRRPRPLLWALAAAGLVWAAAQFPAGMIVEKHLFTWGLPLLLLLRLVLAAVGRVRMARAAVPAAALLALVVSLGGCALAPVDGLPSRTTVESVDYDLKAEKDSMELSLKARVATPGPASVPLLKEGAILLTPERISDDVEVVRDGGRYSLSLKKAGAYNLDLKFLCPLDPAGEDQVRHFTIPSPLALTNRVRLTVPATGMEIESPTAVRLTKEETPQATSAQAVVGPGNDIFFVWRPRTRQTKLEKTAFFAEVISLVRFDTGLAEGRHLLRLQIAHGELKDIRVALPDNMAVTTFEGPGVGAWRFDPTKHELEARLAQPVSGEYTLLVGTQIASDTMPWKTSLAVPRLPDAVRQRGIMGLLTSNAVYLTPSAAGQGMNVDDFARQAAAGLASVPWLKESPVRHAWRMERPEDAVAVEVNEVRPEIRTVENAGFTVADDRLVYNGTIEVEISKSGVFAVELALPKGYDIDALSSPEVSHWDETPVEGRRVVQVHFRKRLLGKTTLKATLSRAVAELPPDLAAPRIEVAGALKHTGQLLITSDRGVRLSVGQREGVSELSPLELGVRERGALAFRLLRPQWDLSFKTEVVKPRVNVEFLHVARVSDGQVRHTHHLMYQLYNAGAKVFEVQAPPGALGLTITGPEIAHLKEVENASGRWRVELTQKRFEERPYPLTLRYETQFDRGAGEVKLAPAVALGTDLQRGHVVIYATDRVEIASQTVGPTLQPADARSLQRRFGESDLSGAAFCYYSTAPEYDLSLRATRHAAASLLEAEVLEAAISTVINEQGETLNRVQMRLRVGDKRHLEARLPQGARVWSLLVNQRSEAPSTRRAESGEEVTLIPLAQAASVEIPVDLELTYAAPPTSGWRFAEQRLVGPRFDLPLRNVSWRLYLPDGFRYGDFEGTLAVNEETLRRPVTLDYDLAAYDRTVFAANVDNIKKAKELQSRGDALARKGMQQEAKQTLELARNYAYNDPQLNEDTRVQYHNLIRQQAVVGLVGQRGLLRQQKGVAPTEQPTLGARFDQAEAERVQSSLSQDDNVNLDRITTRLIQMQEMAAGSRAQLTINVPLRGRQIELQRVLQVKPNSDMLVSFDASREVPPRTRKSATWAAGLAVGLFVLLAADRRLARRRPAAPEPPANA